MTNNKILTFNLVAIIATLACMAHGVIDSQALINQISNVHALKQHSRNQPPSALPLLSHQQHLNNQDPSTDSNIDQQDQSEYMPTYNIADPKAVVEDMVASNITFFPLDLYQSSRRFRRKLRKFYYRERRRQRKEFRKKQLEELKMLWANKGKMKYLKFTAKSKYDSIMAEIRQNVFKKILGANKDYFLTTSLFEGDIMVNTGALKVLNLTDSDAHNKRLILSHLQKRITTTQSQYLWPVTVPYEFDSTTTPTTRTIIQDAMNRIRDNTCLDFQIKSPGTVDYLQFTSTMSCSSFIGRLGGAQPVSLSPSCIDPATAEHEIGHALGLFHMHSRHDRDSYVQINSANVQPGKLVNFEAYDHSDIDHKNLEYDYKSVMHYGEYDYSSNGQKTIQAHNGVQTGLAAGLSYLDFVSINLLYGCYEHTPHYWNFDSFHPSGDLAGTTVAQKGTTGTGPSDKLELITGQNKNALNIKGGYFVNLGSFQGRCIEDPAQCSHGLSVLFWVKIDTSEPTTQYILATKTDSGNDHGFAIKYIGYDYFDIQFIDSGYSYRAYASSPINFEQWTHMAVVWERDIDDLKIYFDGQHAASKYGYGGQYRSPISSSASTYSNLILGKPANLIAYHASYNIDDLVIYEKVVPQSKIASVMLYGPYHDKPSFEGSSGQVHTAISQIAAGSSVAWA